MKKTPHILAIESSCDETSAAILRGREVLSNLIATQKIHEDYGGVVPELASREHQKNITPVVDQAIQQSGIRKEDIDAIAYTRGPGLLGSLLVGSSFAKGLSLALEVPLIEVHHMQAHILAHFIVADSKTAYPEFPFLCLTVSGGHTQIVRVDSHKDFKVLGESLDDAAGEAFDKVAKILGLPYPGGPEVDKLAKDGNADAFSFPEANIPALNMSFSGLKTAVLYFVRDHEKQDPGFVKRNMSDICASVQKVIVDTLLNKLEKAALEEGIEHIALAGGVSANSLLRSKFKDLCVKHGWKSFIPKFEYCTDNAAMIGIVGYFKYVQGETAALKGAPQARMVL